MSFRYIVFFVGFFAIHGLYAQSDRTVCGNQTVQLNEYQGSRPRTPGGRWTVNNGTITDADGNSPILDANTVTLNPLNTATDITLEYVKADNTRVGTPVVITIAPPANPGTLRANVSTQFCSNNLPTSLDLSTLIEGQDPGGTYTDNANNIVANGIANLQQIFTTSGAGTYNYKYTVIGQGGCAGVPSVTTIPIEIAETLNTQGYTFAADSDVEMADVAATNFTGTLTPGANLIPNGTYDVTYEVTLQGNVVAPGQTASVVISNGLGTFNIPNTVFSQSGTYQVNVTAITKAGSPESTCNTINFTDSITIEPTSILSIEKFMLSSCTAPYDVIVYLTSTPPYPDSNYTFTYSLSGANTAAGRSSGAVAFKDGKGNFRVPNAHQLTTGKTTVTITEITPAGGVAQTSDVQGEVFLAEPVDQNFTISTPANANNCANGDVQIIFDGMGANHPQLKVTYNLTRANTSTANVATTVLNGANLIFFVPAALSPAAGETTVTITKIEFTNGCTVENLTTSTNFNKPAPPAAPVVANTSLDFCQDQNPTGSNLQPEIGATIRWYDASNAVVAATSALASGKYSVVGVDASGCESNPVEVNVSVIGSGEPANVQTQQSFCDSPTPTVAQILPANIAATSNFTVYNSFGDAQLSANALSTGTALAQQSYWVVQTVTLPNCTAVSQPTEVKVEIMSGAANNLVLSETRFHYCDTANPTIKDLQEGVAKVSSLPEIPTDRYIVYDSETATTPLAQTERLTEKDYWVSYEIVQVGGACTTTRVKISFVFTNNFTPTVAPNQAFCKDINPTVANLSPNGQGYVWYQNATTTTPLASDTPIKSGEYWVSQKDALGGCETQRASVIVKVESGDIAQAKQLSYGRLGFCEFDSPKVGDLKAKILANQSPDYALPATQDVSWTLNSTGIGDPITDTTSLKTDATYYTLVNSSTTACAPLILVVQISLSECEIPDNVKSIKDLVKIPQGFSPNGDGINDAFRIQDIRYYFPDYSVEIYDRFGNMVHRFSGDNGFWQGDINGQNAMPGPYFYVINASKGGKNLSEQGVIYLLR